MLAHVTEFPQVGSTGFLRGTAAPARIIQQRADGRLLVSVSDDELPQIRKHCTIEQEDIYATAELARWCGKPPSKPRSARRPGRA